MRTWSLVAALLAGTLFVACKKESQQPEAKQRATLTTGTVGADGVRTIAIATREDGYSPDRIPGKPGEKLKLVFTRTIEGECFAELKTPEGKVVPLPMGSPMEIAVTVPQDGEVKFACGMDMFHGVIVAEKS